jgi:ubiquinone/menaquinone biosynthesis C-methylase UbiE
MKRLNWQTARFVTIAGHRIPCAEDLYVTDVCRGIIRQAESPGIRRDDSLRKAVKRVIWPVVQFRADWLSDGFITRWASREIRCLAAEETALLEVGCGRGRLVDRLPRGVTYNGVDIAFSEFQLERLLARHPSVNIAMADAKSIPLADNCVDLLVSTEVLVYIPRVESAITELRRVAKPGAHLVCSIPNSYARKYEVKGRNPAVVNDWTFGEFAELMLSLGWQCETSKMAGWWIPVRTPTSYQIPLTSNAEKHNTNFFYVFRSLH